MSNEENTTADSPSMRVTQNVLRRIFQVKKLPTQQRYMHAIFLNTIFHGFTPPGNKSLYSLSAEVLQDLLERPIIISAMTASSSLNFVCE
jgi:hypothetical protein